MIWLDWLEAFVPIIVVSPMWIWMLLDIHRINKQIEGYKELGKIKYRQSMAEWKTKQLKEKST